MFAESLVTQEAWAVLDKLDEKIALKWIMPDKGGCVPFLPFLSHATAFKHLYYHELTS